MNSSVYLFGKLGANGFFTQYPDDSSKAIFKRLIEQARTKTQLCIHRNGELIYYAYIRKLTDESKCIGLCILLNGSMMKQIEPLFTLFENTMEKMLRDGHIVRFNENGDIIPAVNHLYERSDEISNLRITLQGAIERLSNQSKKLPPVNFAISKDTVKHFSIDDNINDIIESSHSSGFTFVYKSKDFNTEELNSVQNTIRKLRNANKELKKDIENLKSENNKLKRQQRNTTWVAILGVIAAFLGVIIWFKVINPSEVTNKSFPEFNYYGQMNDQQPNGVGVAVYHEDDPDGRKYYIGRFNNGNRQDDKAMLLYENGDFFYGQMEGDNWIDGIYYSNSDNSHFQGRFVNNEPSTGVWYDHKEEYSIFNGHEER
ncbi:MAG: hypothetical protein IKR25_04555 [Muribaculaceae bacterium]|nr:hypothetical protein [Muribaculaceae bacterium]